MTKESERLPFCVFTSSTCHLLPLFSPGLDKLPAGKERALTSVTQRRARRGAQVSLGLGKKKDLG